MTQRTRNTTVENTNIDEHHPANIDGTAPYRGFLKAKEEHGKAASTIRKYAYDLKRFRVWFEHAYPDDDLDDVTPESEHPRKFYHFLCERADGDGLATSTRKNTVITVREFWEYLKNRGYTDAEDPWWDTYKRAKTDDQNSGTGSYRKELTHGEMSDFICGIRDEQIHSMAMFQVKATARRGTTVNMDLPWFHIDHPDARDYYDDLNIELNPKIADKPDTMIIPEGVDAGDVCNGEVRGDAWKPNQKRLVPIDDELKGALLRWLAQRPKWTDTLAMWPSTAVYQGKRMDADTYSDKFKREAERAGYYDRMQGLDDNVTSHYPRHWTTTYLRMFTPMDGIVIDTLRGDSSPTTDDGGTKDTYSHVWFDTVMRPQYEENVPKFY